MFDGNFTATNSSGNKVFKGLKMGKNLFFGMIIALALLETASIYVLLIVLILLFANPLITRFFGG